MRRIMPIFAIALAFGPRAGSLQAEPDLFVDQLATGLNNGTSWTNAYTELKDAVLAASDDDILWVAAGDYKTGTTAGSTFQLRPGMKIFGGFKGSQIGGGETTRSQRNTNAASNSCVLSGDLGGGTHAQVIVTCAASDPFGELDAFTVSGAASQHAITCSGGSSPTLRNLRILDHDVTGFDGTAILIENASNPSLTNVFCSGNRSTYDVGTGNGGRGGAIFISDGGGTGSNPSNPVLSACTFEDNHAINASGISKGGAVYIENGGTGTPLWDNCVFTENDAERGGSIYTEESRPRIRRGAFTRNTAQLGGAIFSLAGSAEILRSIFSSNNADDGAAIFVTGDGLTRVITSVFQSNTAQTFGGGVALLAIYSETTSAEAEIWNCAFHSNHADIFGGGLSAEEDTSVSITNSLFDNNSAGSLGGGCFFKGPSATVINCTYSANHVPDANAGGGIAFAGYDLFV